MQAAGFAGMVVKRYFSPDYETARGRFREAAARAGGRCEAIRLDVRGPRGEELTIDLACFGQLPGDHAVLHFSGLHGVEGFAGSAIQLQLLDEMPLWPEGSGVILIHGVNPYGMAWRRRVNESNVDLNRNFLAPGQPYSGAPDGYRRLNRFLNPERPPGWLDWSAPSALWLLARYGWRELRQAVAGGQYEYPKGLFFGGRRLEASIALLRPRLQRMAGAARRVTALDVHTGLGEYGEDMLLHGCGESAARRGELTRRFGPRAAPLNRSGAAYEVRGGFLEGLERELAGPDWTRIGQEFGTFGALRILRALRDENRWHHYGAGDKVDHPVKRRLLRAFCPEDDGWRRRVLARGRELFEQSLA